VPDVSSTEEKTLKREELVRFFGVLSHDLKSPIFSIDGFSDLLLSDYADKLDDDGRDFLQRIRAAAGQMKRVLDSMSHMVKLLSRPNAPREVDLNEIVEELRLKNNNLLEGGALLETAGALPSVYADPEKIREALGALVTNALTFTDRPSDQRRVTIEASKDGAFDQVCVIDNGMGMDPRYVGQIFELGLKLDKTKGPGAGYGLYLAREVIESHGGRLTVETTPDSGSRFCFTLPSRP
jgi:two-component system sensor kinase FixL